MRKSKLGDAVVSFLLISPFISEVLHIFYFLNWNDGYKIHPSLPEMNVGNSIKNHHDRQKSMAGDKLILEEVSVFLKYSCVYISMLTKHSMFSQSPYSIVVPRALDPFPRQKYQFLFQFEKDRYFHGLESLVSSKIRLAPWRIYDLKNRGLNKRALCTEASRGSPAGMLPSDGVEIRSTETRKFLHLEV